MSGKVDGKQVFENIYDTYNAPLYGIILKNCKSVSEAEEILIQAFKTFFDQSVAPEINDLTFMHLLKVAIGVVSEKTSLSKQNIAKQIFKDVYQFRIQQTLHVQSGHNICQSS
jgi:hypothetical protein